ncbi:hypothetical protein Tel_13595 [Candidatus Tenderia electrophaga]|jgi:hypothetical protein|uniref:Uncharacterized protein n=1 Tax=Candidatus Tenderia electrophaga TaxID=1748243 RepID=A0A0S2TG46_9GAMM|nr:hypothetical protein Tel_13595 [Candidatus Tenderia electrophaga]
MRINPVEICENGDIVVVSSLIEHAGKKERLWYSVDKRYKEYLTTEKLDSFLVGLIYLAMQAREDVVVKGAVSEKLFYNLTQYYIPILRRTDPSLNEVSIVPDSFDKGAYSCAGAVVTGFSAGIDSFCAVYDHLIAADVPDGFKITHFAFNNVGSHGLGNDAEHARRLFNLRYDLIKGFPNVMDIPFIKIDSNINEIFTSSFQKTHVPRNVSAVLLLQKLFSKYYYASAYRYQDAFVGNTNSMAYADAMAVHLLSTETLDCISTGGQYSRVEKTGRVAMIEGVSKWLNVCVGSKDGMNCSACWKCTRTLFTLELLGELDKFANVFDLNKWYEVREAYIVKTLLGKSDDPFIREIREYAEKIGYSPSLSQKLSAKMVNNIPAPLSSGKSTFINKYVPYRLRKLFA